MFYLFLAIGLLGTILTVVLLVSEKSFSWLCKNPRGAYFCPTVIFISLMVFGYSGCLLPRFTGMSTPGTLITALALAGVSTVITNVVLYWVYRHQDMDLIEEGLLGSFGEVIIPIPSGGYGEVDVDINGNVFTVIASSNDSLCAGRKVLVESVIGAGTVKVVPA